MKKGHSTTESERERSKKKRPNNKKYVQFWDLA